MTPITSAWLLTLMLSGQPACQTASVVEEPVQTVILQPLGERTAHRHDQTASWIRVGDRTHLVQTQETTFLYGDGGETFVRFQVYIDGTYRHAGIPRFDAPARVRPLWCDLPTSGTVLHP